MPSQSRFQPDPPGDRSQLHFPSRKPDVRLHQDVRNEAAKIHQSLLKKLDIALRYFMAYGRPSSVKSTKGVNDGWLRSPLGSNQYYLWWVPPGSSRIPSNEARNAIWIRTVRHHDDTDQRLDIEDINGYEPPLTLETLEDECSETPWTDRQLQFIEGDKPVRVLLGRPGSGKTLALWQAVERRGSQQKQNVLYLTWSSALTDSARAWFDTFTPSNSHVDTQKYTWLLSELCGENIHHRTLDDSFASFRTIVESVYGLKGSWATDKRRLFSLYAELRAVLLGGTTVCAQAGSQCTDGWLYLENDEYRKMRQANVGQETVDKLLHWFPLIRRDERLNKQLRKKVFPELQASLCAGHRLRENNIPDSLVNYDCIVLDEVQDLTLLEFSVVVQLCRGIARHRGRAPWLLISGDEGQTVRPSGFAWESINPLLSDLLSDHLQQRPEDTSLESNQRSPKRVVEVINRASNLYTYLSKKKLRPGSQSPERQIETVTAEEENEGRLGYVEIPDLTKASLFLQEMNQTADLKVLSLEDDIPDWVKQTGLRLEVLLTPAEAKGLEYQTVCVLDPGPMLLQIKRIHAVHEAVPELEDLERRTRIDHLRVALSRSTETLIFADYAPSKAARAASMKLLGKDAEVYAPEEWDRLVRDRDLLSIPERVSELTDRARRNIDQQPVEAWRNIHTAAKLIGDSQAFDTVPLSETKRVFLEIATRLTVEPHDTVDLEEVNDTTQDFLKAWAWQAEAAAWEALATWAHDHDAPFALFALLNSLTNLDQEQEHHWPQRALEPVRFELEGALKRFAKQSDAAICYIQSDVEGWLRWSQYSGDRKSKARDLLCDAVETLIQIDETEWAEKGLQQIDPPEPRLTRQLGQHYEAQGNWAGAREVFQRLDAKEDIDRVLAVWVQDCFDQANALWQKEEYKTALQHIDKAVQLKPSCSLDEFARDPMKARYFLGNVETWLQRQGVTDKVVGEARSLRCQAVETLLQAGDANLAARILHQVEPPEWQLAGRVHETQGRLEDALTAYRRAGSDQDVHRVQQALGDAAFARGQELLRQGQYDAAWDHFDLAMDQEPSCGSQVWQSVCAVLDGLNEAGRHSAQALLLTVAVRYMVDVPAGLHPPKDIGTARETIQALAGSHHAEAFWQLHLWTRRQTESPLALLKARQALGAESSWLAQALNSRQPLLRQTLEVALDAAADDPGQAQELLGDVESWLRLAGATGNAADRARSWRCQAVETLLQAGDANLAARMLHQVEPPDWQLTGRVHETQGHLADALAAYRRAGSDKDVLHVQQALGGVAFARGQELLRQGQYDAAWDHFDSAMTQKPSCGSQVWQSVCAVLDGLNEASLPNEATDKTGRRAARALLLTAAVRYMVDVPTGLHPPEDIGAARETIQSLAGSHHAEAFWQLHLWTRRQTESPLALLKVLQALGMESSWLEQVLRSRQSLLRQTLEAALNAAADDPGQAQELLGDVESWLRLAGATGNVANRARSWRCQAVETLLQAGNANLAAQILHQVEPPEWQLAGRVHETQGRLEDALAAYRRAGSDQDVHRVQQALGGAAFARGQELLRQGQYDAALQSIDEAMHWDPSRSLEELARNSEYAWCLSGDIEAWLRLRATAGNVVERVRILRGQAVETLIQAKQADWAAHILEQMKLPDPHLTEQLGHLYEKQGQWEKALDALEKTLNSFMESAAQEDALRVRTTVVHICFDRGNVLLQEKACDQAIAKFDRVMDLDPNHAKACIARGKAWCGVGKPEEAMVDHDRAHKLCAGNAESECQAALFNLLGLVHECQGEYKPAIKRFDRAIKLSAARSNKRGLTLHDSAEAWQDSAEAWRHKERIYDTLGKTREAGEARELAYICEHWARRARQGKLVRGKDM